MPLQPIPKQAREVKGLTNSQNGVNITEERIMINTTRAQTQEEEVKKHGMVV